MEEEIVCKLWTQEPENVDDWHWAVGPFSQEVDQAIPNKHVLMIDSNLVKQRLRLNEIKHEPLQEVKTNKK